MDLTVQTRPLEVLLVGGDEGDLKRVRNDLPLPHFNVEASDWHAGANGFQAPGEVDLLIVRLVGDRLTTLPTPAVDLPVVALTDAVGEESRLLALEAGAVEQVGLDELGTTVLMRVARFALERHRLESELRRMAHADPLTGLRNRRYLFKRMASAVASSRRHGHPLSIAMCDIDHFKEVNDTYGHTVGDELLRAIANVLRSGLRTEDAVARFGGDEFCLVLPHVGAKEAERAVERIRRSLGQISVPVDGETLSVSATFGIAELTEDMGGTQELFDAADQALMSAKQGGRNRSATAG